MKRELLSREEALKVLSERVEWAKYNLDTFVVQYESWLEYYAQYINLERLFSTSHVQKIDDLASSLGESLVDADVFCSYDSDIENLNAFKDEIREALAQSKILAIK